MVTNVTDTTDWLLAVPVQQQAGQVADFSGTPLSLALTPVFGGDPIATASSTDGTLSFVPGSTPYFTIDLRVADRAWRVSNITVVLGDILRRPDPLNPARVEWLGRIALRVHPGSASAGIARAAGSPVLIPAQPYEGRLALTPLVLGLQGPPGAALPAFDPIADDGKGLTIVGGVPVWAIPGGSVPIPGSGDQTITLTAVQTISGHRVARGVTGGIGPCGIASISDADTAIGITEGAALAGSPATVRYGGMMTDTTWAWVEGPVFIGPDGTLTQAPPRAAYEQRVGTAMSATQLVVDIEPAFIFAA